MSDGDVGSQEYISKNEDTNRSNKTPVPITDGRQGFINSIKGALGESFYGLRVQKLKVAEHAEILAGLRRAQEELYALEKTPERLEREYTISLDEFEAKRAEYRHLASRRNLDEQRLQREIQEEGYKQEIQDLEQQVKKASLKLQLEEIKQRRLELQGRATEPQKEVVDPHVEQARTEIKRYMDRHQYLGRDKKQWFTQIDGDLESGEISKDLAKWMKEDIEQIIRDNVLSP